MALRIKTNFFLNICKNYRKETLERIGLEQSNSLSKNLQSCEMDNSLWLHKKLMVKNDNSITWVQNCFKGTQFVMQPSLTSWFAIYGLHLNSSQVMLISIPKSCRNISKWKSSEKMSLILTFKSALVISSVRKHEPQLVGPSFPVYIGESKENAFTQHHCTNPWIELLWKASSQLQKFP